MIQPYEINYVMAGSSVINHEVIAAESEREAIKAILAKGGTPIEVRVSKAFKTPLSNDYKQQFLLAVLFGVQSGMSSSKALEEVILSQEGGIKNRFSASLSVLQGGGTFAAAMAALDIFDDAVIAIVLAGEETGSMAQALTSAVEHYGKTSAARKMLFGAVTILSIDLFASVTSIFGVQYSLLPSIEQSGVKSEDPVVVENFARSLKMAYFINGTMLWATVAVCVVALAAWSVYRDRTMVEQRAWIDNKISQIPILGEVMKHSALASTFGICATLISGGVRLLPSIRITLGASNSQIVTDYWERIAKDVESGNTVSQSLQDPLLERSENLILKAHTDTRQLAQAMAGIAKRREELAVHANKRFGKAALLGTLFYSGLSVLVALWVAYLQYQGMMSGLTSIGGG